MKSHYCEAEGTEISYEGECNWCGDKEMNKLEQAARQALEALEELHYSSGTVVAVRMYESATAALREALAEQAEQEPVGVVEGSGEWGIAGVLVAGVSIGTKLYAAPVCTKDLTDDEIRDALDGCEYDEDTPFEITEARAVIAADREKNK